jgi:thioredoxin reductase (NADPH)
VEEALFLKTYTSRVTLIPVRRMTLATRDKERLKAANIALLHEVPSRIVAEAGSIRMEFGNGPRRFDCLYTALGCRPQTKSVAGLGVRLSKAGCVIAGKHQETSVPGLFAAGDVVESLDQISVAVGQAAIAATALHNYLRQRE